MESFMERYDREWYERVKISYYEYMNLNKLIEDKRVEVLLGICGDNWNYVFNVYMWLGYSYDEYSWDYNCEFYLLLVEGVCIFCGKDWSGWCYEWGYIDGEFICDDCVKRINDIGVF